MKYYLLLLVVSLFMMQPLSAQKNALNFDGTNDYVSTTVPSISGNTAKTMEAWVRTTANCLPVSSGGTGQKVILDMGTFINGQRFTFNILWSNAIRLEVGGNGLSDTTTINDGLWHHVAATYDPSLTTNQVKLYVDGVLKTQGNLTVGVNTGTASGLIIGRRVDNVNYFQGDIDEVRVWNVARSAADIAANYNKELCAPFSSNLKAYYRLNQGLAAGTNTGLTTANNSASTGNGTLIGFALSGASSNWVAGNLLPGSSSSSLTINQCAPYTTSTGQLISTSGTYYDTFTNAVGCDSILTYYATIGGSMTSITESACGQYISPSGNTYSTSGVYQDTLSNSAGCDSIINITLTVNQSSTGTITANPCGSYTAPSGAVFTASGTYFDTIPNTAGCDSVITLNLNFQAGTLYSDTVIACEMSYTAPDGTIYGASGTYRDTFLSVSGCDSIVELVLYLEYIDNTVIHTDSSTANVLHTGLSYQWYTCDGFIIHNGIGPFITNGTGAPVSVYVVLSGNYCSDTSECITLPWTLGINELDKSGLKIYPNPVTDVLHLESQTLITSLTIYNMLGQKMLYREFNPSDDFDIDLETLVPGNYILEALSEEGSYRHIIQKK